MCSWAMSGFILLLQGSPTEQYCTARIANRRKLLGFFFLSMEGQDLWALLSSMAATEEEYRQKGGKRTPNQTFLMFRWTPARTGSSNLKLEEQWLHHDAQRLNSEFAVSRKVPVGTCSGREAAPAASIRKAAASALRQQGKASNSQTLQVLLQPKQGASYPSQSNI